MRLTKIAHRVECDEIDFTEFGGSILEMWYVVFKLIDDGGNHIMDAGNSHSFDTQEDAQRYMGDWNKNWY